MGNAYGTDTPGNKLVSFVKEFMSYALVISLSFLFGMQNETNQIQ